LREKKSSKKRAKYQDADRSSKKHKAVEQVVIESDSDGEGKDEFDVGFLSDGGADDDDEKEADDALESEALQILKKVSAMDRSLG
jgi:hypothetical protein